MIPELKLQVILRGLRQTDVAKAAGVGKSYVNRIVNGKQKPSAKVVEALKNFGIQVEKK